LFFFVLVEMQRLRKDSEPVSSPGLTTVPRVRRESDRLRSEILPPDAGSTRNPVNLPTNREVRTTNRKKNQNFVLSILRKQKFIVFHHIQIQLLCQVP
jgi:hypothetical protein